MNEPSSRAMRLEELLDQAFDLEGADLTRFLESVDPEFRDELSNLLKADAAASPVDATLTGLHEVASAFFSSDSTASSVAAGQRIGHYRLLRLLGEGGMASVWLGERDDATFAHRVAVKCLRTGFDTRESRTRFLREQQILAQLQHPNIARLYDAGISQDGVPFIVMEWVDGVSLTRYCDEHRLGIRQRLDLFQKIAATVAYAHQNLIVHRDLKPGNILIGNDAEPKLLDFGIAKLLNDSAEPMTRTGVHLLTPEYAAPEQFSGGAITTATDVYALGAMLYELLSGLRPRHYVRGKAVDTTTPVTAPSEALKRAPKTQDLLPIAQSRRSVPERLRRLLQGDLDTIALKALQTDSARRYPTVQALSDDIARYLEKQPILARKDAWTYRVGMFLQRHALAISVTTLMVSALITATGISIYQARRAKSQTMLAQTEAKRATAVESFLISLFKVADSGLPRDKVPSTETLLEDGAKRIRSEFNDAPELKLDLLLLLGPIQGNLGIYDSAESLLKEAVALADATLTPANEVWLQTHTEWAALLNHQARFEEAVQHLTLMITQYKAATTVENKQLIEALLTLGEAYDQGTWGEPSDKLNHIAQAVIVTQQALAMSLRLFGEHNETTQKVLQQLGTAFLYADRFDEAEATQRRNAALSRDLYGDHNAKFAKSLALLGDVLIYQNKHAESEKTAKEALTILEAVYNRPNTDLVSALQLLGHAEFMQYKFDDAEMAYQRALEMQTQLISADDRTAISCWSNIVNIAVRQRQYGKAERLLRQFLKEKRETSKSSKSADVLQRLAFVLIKTRRNREALPLLEEALGITEKDPRFANLLKGMILSRLALAENGIEQSSQALTHIDEALNVSQEALAPEDVQFTRAWLIKAQILNQLKHYKEALDLLTPMMASLRQTGLEQHVVLLAQHQYLAARAESTDLADGLTELGRAEWGLGNKDRAVKLWDEALIVLRASKASNAEIIHEMEQRIATVRNE